MKRFCAIVTFLYFALFTYADASEAFWALVPDPTGKAIFCDVTITAKEENADFPKIVREALKAKQVAVKLVVYYCPDGFVCKTVTDGGELVLDVGHEMYDVTYYRLGRPNNLELAMDGGLDMLLCAQIPLYYWDSARRHVGSISEIVDGEAYREVRFWIDDANDKAKKQVALIRFASSEDGLTSVSVRQIGGMTVTKQDLKNPRFAPAELLESPERRQNVYDDYRDGIPFTHFSKARSSIFGHTDPQWAYDLMTKVQSVQVIPPGLTRADIVKQLVGQHKKLRGLDDGLAIGRRPVPQKTPWLKWIAWALAIAGAIGGSYIFLRKSS